MNITPPLRPHVSSFGLETMVMIIMIFLSHGKGTFVFTSTALKNLKAQLILATPCEVHHNIKYSHVIVYYLIPKQFLMLLKNP